jgi:hypothetical protein
LVNGHPVDGEMVVHDGDHLKVGTLHFTFSIKQRDGSPMTAPVEERDVKWLLDVPEDSEALSVGRPTRLMPASADEDTMSSATATAAGTSERKRPSKVVSAGQHLRDYFQQRKHPPANAGGIS